LPQTVIDDRKAFFNFMDFDNLENDITHLTAQFRAQADLVDQQLRDGRPFMFGAAPGLADIHAYFPIWMARGNVPTAAAILGACRRLAAWEERMQALGHGSRTALTASQAHAIARDSTPARGAGVDPDDLLGLTAGDRVSVTPDDYGRDPVIGELDTLALHEVAVRRVDPLAGTVVVHFPRIGYRIARA
jgi:hypothetical protein